MAFKMKHKLTPHGLRNRSNTPLYNHHNENIDPRAGQPVVEEVSNQDGVKTLRRTTVTGQPGTYESTGIEFEDSWNNMSEEKKKKFKNFEDYKQQAEEYIETKKKGTQRELVEEKTITETSTDPTYETVTETIESLPLFGNQQNYDEANWRGMTRYMLNSNSTVFPAIIADFTGRQYMRTSKDELVKLAYDADPAGFEQKLRSFYPEMFGSDKPLPKNTREVTRQVDPGSNNVTETPWTVVSNTTTKID